MYHVLHQRNIGKLNTLYIHSVAFYYLIIIINRLNQQSKKNAVKASTCTTFNLWTNSKLAVKISTALNQLTWERCDSSSSTRSLQLKCLWSRCIKRLLCLNASINTCNTKEGWMQMRFKKTNPFITFNTGKITL